MSGAKHTSARPIGYRLARVSVVRPAKTARVEKPEGLRQAMAWLHTWSGLLLGWVLFAMFLTGTLAFFRLEIMAWMKPGIHVQRAWMDGHNALSVLGLQFHLMITFTGLVLFMSMLMSAGIKAAYENTRAYNTDMFPQFLSSVKPAGVAAPLAPIGPMAALVQPRWNEADVGSISVNHPGDANAVVNVSASPAPRASYGRLPPGVVLVGAPGEPTAFLGEDNAVRATAGTLIGLHLGLFAEPVLRWLYFLVNLRVPRWLGPGWCCGWSSAARRPARMPPSGSCYGWSMA